MANPIDIQKLAKEQGVDLGSIGSRNTPDSSKISDIVNIFKKGIGGLVFSELGQMSSSEDSVFKKLQKEFPSIANAMQQIRSKPSSY